MPTSKTVLLPAEDVFITITHYMTYYNVLEELARYRGDQDRTIVFRLASFLFLKLKIGHRSRY